MSEHRVLNYLRGETLEKCAAQLGRKPINDDNRKELFMDIARQTDMSYSYKPVLIKAILANADSKPRCENIGA